MAREDNATPPTTLAFSHATFAKLTPKAYLQAHLQNADTVRPNNRKPGQFRDVAINTGSLANSNGSAVVRLGDTAVVCGVRAEILATSDMPMPPNNIADDDLVQHLGLLVPNLELSTGCSPAHLPGNPPSGLAQSLTWRLRALLNTTGLVAIDELRIQYEQPALEDDDDGPKLVTKAYWTLYLDILCMSLDGSCFDAAWIALLAALQGTKLPKAAWDPDRETILCSPRAEEALPLRLSSLPVASTFAAFTTASPLRDPALAENWTLADPDAFEEDACSEFVTITTGEVDIARIEKSGGSVLSTTQVRHCISSAVQRRKDVVSLLARK
ncbi:hypothetical protein AMS68_006671 [Peltaster fructicola]|uniref:Ribosomal RNA-processing protein 43 n=1 Tax=Peltaster fructicola TaxID=286661 RepID=A0A6H0Y2B5_9PEZI|nr:hypothetical protein AMS68_006671 [Peltaster fructicola]